MRPYARTEHFVFYARANELGHARLGIVVAKRFAPRAVTRNTVRRICREVFRHMQLPARDCIVRIHVACFVFFAHAPTVRFRIYSLL